METFSALLAICAGNSPVPGEFPAQRPVTRSFDVFFDLRSNKRLSKLVIWGAMCPLWRHRNVAYSCVLHILFLIHSDRVAPICVDNLNIRGSDNGLSPGRHQAIIWTHVVNWTLRNKFRWNFNRNSNIFIDENTFENVVCEMLSISSRALCVDIQIYVGDHQHSSLLHPVANTILFEYMLRRSMYKCQAYIPLHISSTTWNKHKVHALLHWNILLKTCYPCGVAVCIYRWICLCM